MERQELSDNCAPDKEDDDQNSSPLAKRRVSSCALAELHSGDLNVTIKCIKMSCISFVKSIQTTFVYL